MGKFTVKQVKEKFIAEQVETNLSYVENRLLENKPLNDAFYSFSQKEGFALDSFVHHSGDFSFQARLSSHHNSEQNDGQIVFTRQEFEKAVLKKKQQPKPSTVDKKLPVKSVEKVSPVTVEEDTEEQNQDE